MQKITDRKPKTNDSKKAEPQLISFAQQLMTGFHQISAPFFVGVNGCQGSGKSTFSNMLAAYIESEYSLKSLVISLDDFYLSKNARQQLALDIHPLLSIRGVPGTHDVSLLKQILVKLKQKEIGFSVPCFDKATDDLKPQTQWSVVNETVDIVIVEGWCWGSPAQNQVELIRPVNRLERDQDSDGSWRHFVNQQIIDNYQPLYHFIDHWLFLQAPSFECVFHWRLQQEQDLAAKMASQPDEKGEHSIQSAEQIAEFILYFQRLTEHTLSHFDYPKQTTFYLDKYRNISLHPRL